MKLLLALLFIISSVEAATLKLEALDQEKLGDLLEKLDPTVRRTIRLVTSRDEESKKKFIFPREEGPVRITCERSYFNGSPYASFTSCTFEVKEEDPGTLKRFDEFEVSLDSSLSEALFAAISYGKPEKVLYSYGRKWGVSFEGIERQVFHFGLKCLPSECKLRAHAKNLL